MKDNKAPATNSGLVAQAARAAYATLEEVRISSVASHATRLCKLLGKSATLARFEDEGKKAKAVIAAAAKAEQYLKVIGGDSKAPAPVEGESLTRFNLVKAAATSAANGGQVTAAAVLAAAIEAMLAFNFEKAAKAKAVRDDRKALNKVLMSRTATPEEQQAALAARTDLDATRVVEELEAAIDSLYKAIVSGRAKGIGRDRALALVEKAYPVTEPATVA
jgi:hypothetical protein